MSQLYTMLGDHSNDLCNDVCLGLMHSWISVKFRSGCEFECERHLDVALWNPGSATMFA